MIGRDWEFIGGNLALDFVNTAGGIRGINAREYLPDYAELVDWSRAAGLLTADEAHALEDQDGAAVRRRAIALREAIYAIATAAMRGDQPDEADLQVLNSELSSAPEKRQLSWVAEGFRGNASTQSSGMDRMLGPVAHAAYELFTSPAFKKARLCSSDTCGWLFLDTTKNHSRRWCEMKSCGNVAKVREFRARKSAKRET